MASRRLASARRAARLAPGAEATRDLAAAVARAGVVLVAVPDREIRRVAETLAREATGPWRGRTVLHHAGLLGTAPLAPLARKGAAVGVLHPLQLLGRTRAARPLLRGSFARIEGDPRAVALARRIARAVGLRPLPLKRRLGDADRAAYHAAASLASNDVVALLWAGADLLVGAGARRRTAVRALARLARGAVEQAEAGGIRAALTGPVLRGDASTVRAQLDRLRATDPGLAEAHRLLSERLLRRAAASSLLSRSRAAAVRRALAGGRRRDRTV